jgi:hypothetical protein
VDYNPPVGAAPISELGIPRMTPPSTTKVLVVSREIHFELSQTVTWKDYGAHLFEYVAKNVGLRAARGAASPSAQRDSFGCPHHGGYPDVIHSDARIRSSEQRIARTNPTNVFWGIDRLLPGRRIRALHEPGHNPLAHLLHMASLGQPVPQHLLHASAHRPARPAARRARPRGSDG